MSAGKDYAFFVTSNGLAGGTRFPVEYQGDITFNTGTSNSRL